MNIQQSETTLNNSNIIKEKLKDKTLSLVKESDMRMIKVPDIFYREDLLKEIRNLLSFHNNFEKISDYEMGKLLAICVDIIGNDTYDTLFEYDNIIRHHIKKFLLTSKPEHALDLATTIEKSLTENYASILYTLFTEQKELLKDEDYRERGFKPITDVGTGEFIGWQRYAN